MKKVGALWLKNSEKIGEYLSGYVDLGIFGENKITVFENNKKDDPESNLPDYVIMLPDEQKND